MLRDRWYLITMTLDITDYRKFEPDKTGMYHLSFLKITLMIKNVHDKSRWWSDYYAPLVIKPYFTII